jgi:tetratricopeptide (TPR) repeat protein
VLHLTGGLVVFGWRDPDRGREVDQYAGWAVDFERLAYRPDEVERAPTAPGTGARAWWEAFYRPAPARPAARDEAVVLLRKCEVMIPSAPVRYRLAWIGGQMGGLVGAAGGWPAAAWPADSILRLALVPPPIPDPAPPHPLAQLAMGLEQQFALERGRAPVGLLYAAVRAARRAVAENPNDANAYFVLAQVYAALVRASAEQGWAARLPQLVRIRQLQASAALNRAVTLNPNLAEAHVELARLYLTLNYLDLAAAHLRAYRDTPARLGGPKKGDRRSELLLGELDKLTEAVGLRSRELAGGLERASVGERAATALQRGLAGEALAVLLKSDVSAFGTPGMEMELELLLRTGRAAEVLERLEPEVRGSLGDDTFSWLRAHAHLALGQYAAADDELSAIVGPGGPAPQELGLEIGAVVGKTLLDQQPAAAATPQIAMRVLSESDFRARMTRTGQKLSRLGDVLVIRGLSALEAGNIDRARDSFRAALAYSPTRWSEGGQLAFPGRLVAWDCLALIDGADPAGKK